MATPIARNVGNRGTTMAIACGTAIAAFLGGTYFMGKDVKQKEGNASLYATGGQGQGGTDKAMTSSDVNAVVSVPKPISNTRLEGATTTAEGK